MVLVGSKPSFQTGGAKTPPGQPALLHYLNFNGKKISSAYQRGLRYSKRMAQDRPAMTGRNPSLSIFIFRQLTASPLGSVCVTPSISEKLSDQ